MYYNIHDMTLVISLATFSSCKNERDIPEPPLLGERMSQKILLKNLSRSLAAC